MCGAPVPKTIPYETFYIDDPGGVPRPDNATPRKPFGLEQLAAILALGASGRAEVRRAGNRRYTAPGTPIKIAQQTFRGRRPRDACADRHAARRDL